MARHSAKGDRAKQHGRVFQLSTKSHGKNVMTLLLQDVDFWILVEQAAETDRTLATETYLE